MHNVEAQQVVDDLALSETRKLVDLIENGDFYTFFDMGVQTDMSMPCESYKKMIETDSHIIALGVNVYDPGDSFGVYLVMVFVLDKTTELSSEMSAYLKV